MSHENQADIQIDPRGYRLGAVITFTIAVIALLLGPSVGGLIVMAVLTAMFLPGAIIGPQGTVQAWIFKTFVRPRLAPPAETESFRPPRFAQQMGLAMSGAALVLGLASVDWGFWLFGALVTGASFLNGAFGFCLGCEIYLLLKRATARPA